MDLVRTLDRTVIAAIHDLNIAALYCHRLYALKDGRLLGQGSPKELLTPKFIRKLYGVNTQRVVDSSGHLHILYCPGAQEDFE